MTKLIKISSDVYLSADEIKSVTIKTDNGHGLHWIVINGASYTRFDREDNARQAQLKIIDQINGTQAYAVIYDRITYEGDREEYFEVFDTPAEARRAFTETFGEDQHIHNARLVQIVERLSDQR